MADPAQDPSNLPSGSQTSPQSGLAADVQGVASVWDFGWRAGQQLAQAFGSATADRRNRKSLQQAQKSYLGPWSDEATYDGVRRRIPVLKAEKKFRDYMLATEGKFQPPGSCMAQAAWAQFVHALGIAPSSNVITWKSPQIDPGEASTSKMTLEIDGETLCHVLNLFSVTDLKWASTLQIRKIEKKGHFNVLFADIQWDFANDAGSVWYALGDDESINAVRLPFGTIGQMMEEDTLVVKHYFNAIYYRHGCSDSDYGLPDHTRPLYERVQDLYLILRKLKELPYENEEAVYYSCERDSKTPRLFETWLQEEVFARFPAGDGPKRLTNSYIHYLRRWTGTKQPVLLTHRWLEEANRIWRRSTTKGGSDMSLLDDVLRIIDETPSEETFRSEMPSWVQDFEVAELKSTVRHGFMLQGDTSFTIELFDPDTVPHDTPMVFSGANKDSRINRDYIPAAKKMIREVLESYKDEEGNKRDPWKHDLYLAREEVLWLMFEPKVIQLSVHYVRFLHFRPESALWNGVWQLRSYSEEGSTVLTKSQS